MRNLASRTLLNIWRRFLKWENSSTRIPVVGLSGVARITSGFGHTCALLLDDTVRPGLWWLLLLGLALVVYGTSILARRRPEKRTPPRVA